MRLRGCLEYLSYCIWNPCKGNDSFEERLDRHFVGRIQRNRVRAALLRSLIREP